MAGGKQKEMASRACRADISASILTLAEAHVWAPGHDRFQRGYGRDSADLGACGHSASYCRVSESGDVETINQRLVTFAGLINYKKLN